VWSASSKISGKTMSQALSPSFIWCQTSCAISCALQFSAFFLCFSPFLLNSQMSTDRIALTFPLP
jgi:hypothetical protein